MICPICNASITDGSTICPACGADLPVADIASSAEFIFCEGCGARLSPQDRTCPKCGRPAPGILSQDSAASDLAAGKTASFPRLTSEMIAGAVPAPSEQSLSDATAAQGPDSTSVLNTGDLSAAQESAARSGAARSAGRKVLPHEEVEASAGKDPYAKPRRGRWIALGALVLVVAGGVWFVSSDPLGVMPGFYESFGDAASDMFPSRQVPEDEPGADAQDNGTDADASADEQAQVSDSELSDAEAYQRLSVAYGKIVSLQEEIGPVVETYNGQYLAKDRSQRESASRSSYELRDAIKGVIEELDGLDLASGSAYVEDVEHLKQLATWTLNRVDVLCRSWDINLGLPEGERPVDHQDEILAPLREVEKVNGKAVDVVNYEENVAAWQPVEK